jgi:hypothetical protein
MCKIAGFNPPYPGRETGDFVENEYIDIILSKEPPGGLQKH